MKIELSVRLKYGISAIAFLTGMAATSSFALASQMGPQEAPKKQQQETKTTPKTTTEDSQEIEEILVTGSRIRRNEFSTASPVQIIDANISREFGEFEIGEMLQNSVQSTGNQIDNTQTTTVLDNGQGGQTVNFRGLGAGRTLVMVNGRRMAPAGAGGAPTAPDVSLIPSLMVKRIESLLDGASSVYGSDAVAGVANIILRKDFEGLEIQGNMNLTQAGGGNSFSGGVIWGTTGDNYSITIGAEYYQRNELTFKDSRFTAHCNEYLYEDETGKRYTTNTSYVPGTSVSSCKLATSNYMFIENSLWGTVWRTPGKTNIGIANYSETHAGGWIAGFNLDPSKGYADVAKLLYDSTGDGEFDRSLFDADGDNLADVDVYDAIYNRTESDRSLSGHLRTPVKRFNIMMNGEFRFDDDHDTTVFVEALFGKRISTTHQPTWTVFPWVPESNPLNPCGANYGGEGQGEGCFVPFGFPWADTRRVQPNFQVIGDRDLNEVTVQQYRVVAGVKGDIPFAPSWRYETYVSFSDSKGTDKMQGILNEPFMYSVNTTRWDPDNPGQLICGDPGDSSCVVMDVFADSLYKPGGGTFATQAETDYVFGTRIAETKVSQAMGGLSVDGDLFDLPWNDEAVQVVLGYEFRRDAISSNPNDVAKNSGFFGWFSDKGADGSTKTHSVFAETQWSLLSDLPMIEELSFNAAVRYTSPEYYDAGVTYSLKGVYRPTDFITLRATYGTSYRSPNLREHFLNGTSSFSSVTDPCTVPNNAKDFNPATNQNDYNAAEDWRVEEAPHIFAACSAKGLDAATLGLNSHSANSSTESIKSGVTNDISEETSKSYTFGFVFSQPWSEDFDLTFAVTRYSIEISNSIQEMSTGQVVNKCFNNELEPGATSLLCDRITRDADGKISHIVVPFVNIGKITAKGLDFNLRFSTDVAIGSQDLSISLSGQATKTTENVTQPDLAIAARNWVGRVRNPKWKASANLRLAYDDFRFSWRTRFIQGGQNLVWDADLGEYSQREFKEGTAARPCFTAGVACRPVDYTKDYMTHNASVTWSPEDKDFAVTFGVRNVFDTAPSKIDTTGVGGVRNFANGAGYDILGRTFFVSTKAKF